MTAAPRQALTSTRSSRSLAVALGLGALVIGGPQPGRITLDERELAAIVEGEVDHVTPDELADWIVAGRQDYRLIDLRPEAEYAAYHIPPAERLSIAALADSDLARNEKIVLYSAEGIHSAQAWFLLKAKKYPAVYILLGGLKQWNEQVIFPGRPAEARLPRSGSPSRRPPSAPATSAAARARPPRALAAHRRRAGGSSAVPPVPEVVPPPRPPARRPARRRRKAADRRGVRR